MFKKLKINYKLFLAIAGIFSLLSCNLQLNRKQHSLELMSFNIRYAGAMDADNPWDSRKIIVAKTIQDVNPDLFGVQEAEYRQLTDLEALLPKYNYFGRSRDDGKQAGEFSAIYYDPKRFILLQQETFWFSKTPRLPGSKNWGNFIPRICTWGLLKDLFSGNTFYVYNMHWDHASQQARLNSGKLLLTSIKQRQYNDAPVVVMGDFNAGLGNLAFDQLLNNPDIPLTDSYSSSHKKLNGTFHGFSGKAKLPAIDSILVSKGMPIIDSVIITMSIKDKYPSDHFPVTAKLYFN